MFVAKRLRSVVGASALTLAFAGSPVMAHAEAIGVPNACAVVAPNTETAGAFSSGCCVVTTNYSLTSTPVNIPFSAYPP